MPPCGKSDYGTAFETGAAEMGSMGMGLLLMLGVGKCRVRCAPLAAAQNAGGGGTAGDAKQAAALSPNTYTKPRRIALRIHRADEQG